MLSSQKFVVCVSDRLIFQIRVGVEIKRLDFVRTSA